MLKTWRTLPLRERVTRSGWACIALGALLAVQAIIQFSSVRAAAIAAIVAAVGFVAGGVLMLTVVRRKLP